jgi:hypothetical protein
MWKHLFRVAAAPLFFRSKHEQARPLAFSKPACAGFFLPTKETPAQHYREEELVLELAE